MSALDSRGRTIFVPDAHRDDGKRFVVRADEKLTEFIELQSAIRGPKVSFSCFCFPAHFESAAKDGGQVSLRLSGYNG